MGDDIVCNIDENGEALTRLLQAEGFNPGLPIKAFAHGFLEEAATSMSLVDAFMEAEEEANVILVDWSQHAAIEVSPSYEGVWEGYGSLMGYIAGARKSLIVGTYVGKCLASLKTRFDIPAEKFHMAGHSLGGQMLGAVGRAFEEKTGEKIGRLTGLDPAGPGFNPGKTTGAAPDLYAARLSKNDAQFVDIIHSNSDFEPAIINTDDPTKFFLGQHQPMGHMDFYPNGGQIQPGCNVGTTNDCMIGCSHDRAFTYFVKSISSPSLFASKACATVEKCTDGQVRSNKTVAYMGMEARSGWNGQDMILFTPIQEAQLDSTSFKEKCEIYASRLGSSLGGNLATILFGTCN